MMDSREKPRYFRRPKKTESAESCQDAGEINRQRGRYAIADGATRSFFPKEWARLLVARFCHDDDRLNRTLFEQQEWQKWLQPAQETWQEEIKQIVARVPASKFYVTNRYAKRDPAVATFVGVQIRASPAGYQWQAMIIGDSCLFVVRRNRIEKSYLIERSQEFGSHPESFASVPRYNKYEPRFINGIAKEGDVLILATDALAKWILTHHEKGSWAKAWHVLHQITTEQHFTTLIDAARENREIPLENDDVTLMIIPIDLKKKDNPPIPEPPPTPVHENKDPQALPGTSYDSPHQKPRESEEATVNLWPKMTLVLSTLLFLCIGVNYLFYNRLPVGTLNPLVREAAITIFLQAGTQIDSPESDSASPVLIIEEQTEASLLSKAESVSQVDIQIQLWVISGRDGIVYATERENSIYIEHEAEAYQFNKDTNELVKVGRVPQDVLLPKTGEDTDNQGVTWYEVGIDGLYTVNAE